MLPVSQIFPNPIFIFGFEKTPNFIGLTVHHSQKRVCLSETRRKFVLTCYSITWGISRACCSFFNALLLLENAPYEIGLLQANYKEVTKITIISTNRKLLLLTPLFVKRRNQEQRLIVNLDQVKDLPKDGISINDTRII